MSTPINILKKSKDWHSFQAILDSLKGKEKLKGDSFEELTELYLRLHPRYATIIKNVWNLRKETSGAIRRKLKLPSSDEGIDLVAETNEGEYWAIQCKYLLERNERFPRCRVS